LATLKAGSVLNGEWKKILATLRCQGTSETCASAGLDARVMLKNRKPSFVPALVCASLLLFAVWFFGPAWSERIRGFLKAESAEPVERNANTDALPVSDEAAELAAARLLARERAGAEWRELLQRRLERRNGRVREAVVIFKDEAAYRRFQIRARAAGFLIIAESEQLRAVRVRYESIAAVQADIFEHVRDYEEIGANTYVDRPAKPVEETRAGYPLVPVRDGLIDVLGAAGDRSQWGRGVTIAVLDSGVAPDATFDQGRLRSLDIGEGVAPGRGDEDGHGTAVAALVAGASADALGVAPAANILSIRVTAEDGRSDIFTVAKGIVAAVDAKVRVINISLGGYDTSVLITRAIDYAVAAGVVIVAASGNDQAPQITWPAADPRVISVGATDADGRQALFSNSGEQLKISAPGVGVQTAWLGGQRVLFSGTSASAPVVAGALAAVMSQKPGTSPQQAWETLQTRSDDAGAPGADAAYGAGVLNLGWAMDNNPARVDLAVASHWPGSGADAGRAEGVVEVVVQNRSGFAVAGAVLEIETNGMSSRQTVPVLAAGAGAVVKVPVASPARAKDVDRWILKTRLIAPGGLIDQVPANNERTSALAPVAATDGR
jgi:hypothetical protein